MALDNKEKVSVLSSIFVKPLTLSSTIPSSENLLACEQALKEEEGQEGEKEQELATLSQEFESPILPAAP